MTVVNTVSGDISNVGADALITAINSGGIWYGGINESIHRLCGDAFHVQADKAMPLKDGQTVIAKGDIALPTPFTNVVFVVDDLQLPLRDIVYNGLKAASDEGYVKVSIPTIRMGILIGVIEKNHFEAVSEMVTGARKFVSDHPTTPVKDITFVVYNDQYTQFLLESMLSVN